MSSNQNRIHALVLSLGLHQQAYKLQTNLENLLLKAALIRIPHCLQLCTTLSSALQPSLLSLKHWPSPHSTTVITIRRHPSETKRTDLLGQHGVDSSISEQTDRLSMRSKTAQSHSRIQLMNVDTNKFIYESMYTGSRRKMQKYRGTAVPHPRLDGLIIHHSMAIYRYFMALTDDILIEKLRIHYKCTQWHL